MTNDDSFMKMITGLQRKIDEEEEKRYSHIVIREYRHPSHFGVLEKPDAVGKVKGPCGDTMKIGVIIHDDRIKNARFWTDGCGATIACGSMLTKMTQGKTITEAARITSEQLITVLEGLPEKHMHCAKLAVDTLQKTISLYNKKEI